MPYAPLDQLVQPIGGLISRVTEIPNHPGEPRFPVTVAALGDITQASNVVMMSKTGANPDGALDGAGSGIHAGESRVRAIGEALERYSSCVYDSRQLIRATARELGRDALDLLSIPRCSARELAHPSCPIVAPDLDAPIRWVSGVSLSTGAVMWVPAMMVYLYFHPETAGERMWLPISTGCAAHTSLERALLSATCEVIERDAIAVTWLQKLPLPRIELDRIPAWLEPYVRRNEAHGDSEHVFFDATTDIGVPTVYSLQLTPHNVRLATLVMCSTELDPSIAVAKVIRESASSRLAMQIPQPLPDRWDDFSAVSHGAAYMGHPDRASAFDFLIHSPHRRRLSEMPTLDTGQPGSDLMDLIERLRVRGMEAIAVDLTTDEGRRTGTWVVRVIVPGLQPLSFSHRARYLGHPRLYDAPRAMGFPVCAESEINPQPQPFA
jgi:ribosomal protein S12 methylthiotransferase accessory factor